MAMDFDLDIEAELAGIRGYKDEASPRTNEGSLDPEKQEPSEKPIGSNSAPKEGAIDTGTVTTQEEKTAMGLGHSHGGEDITSPARTGSDQKKKPAPVNWKRFKTMRGLFEHVGGDRPVQLPDDIRRSQVSGIPEPLLVATQVYLKETYTGAIVTFPWGDYVITEKNKVFTTKASLLRYLLFDGLRDAAGTHVQYAKQWMVLQHPVFDEGFHPDTHLSPSHDELDIYALLYVAHSSEEVQESPVLTERETHHQTTERLGMLNMGMNRIMDKLQKQEAWLQAHAERSTVLQTVLLLDRMGLLQGGLPKDINAFVRVLEKNRTLFSAADDIVTQHVHAEKERQKTLQRQERMKNMQKHSAR